jgi:hypothetical protein
MNAKPLFRTTPPAGLAMPRLALLLAALGLAGCSSLLPDSKTRVEGLWGNFQEAEAMFESIEPYRTTLADLKAMKLDVSKSPNITRLNYSDVMRRFVPPAAVDGYKLEKGVADCLAASSACRGYEINQRFIDRKRYGNVLADILNFRRLTRTDGWSFSAVLLVKDELVIYKITGGQPNLSEQERKSNPLGPLQSIESIPRGN